MKTRFIVKKLSKLSHPRKPEKETKCGPQSVANFTVILSSPGAVSDVATGQISEFKSACFSTSNILKIITLS